jgi:hypothetical protein
MRLTNRQTHPGFIMQFTNVDARPSSTFGPSAAAGWSIDRTSTPDAAPAFDGQARAPQPSAASGATTLRDMASAPGAYPRELANASARPAAPESRATPSPDADFRSQFGALARDRSAFHSTMAGIYGNGYDSRTAEGLRQRALQGDYTWLPPVKWVDSSVLRGAHGAYDTKEGRILLNADLKGSALAGSTFVEEVGHHLDTKLNTRDTKGDEGEMFRRVLGGERLSAEQVEEIRADDDAGTIQVDGKSVQVEFWNPFKKAVNWVREKIVEPVVNTAKGVVRDVGGMLNSGLDFVGRTIAGVGQTAVDMVRGFRDDGFRGAGRALWSHIKDGAKSAGSFIVGMGARAVNTVVNAIDNLRGALKERGLSSDEIQALRRVYGDSIDYSKVRIQSGGMKNGANMTAHVVDNTIWLPKNAFRSDGSVDPDLLVHEVGHVWQYQNRGPGYLGDALVSQITEGRNGHLGSGNAYDWLSAAEKGQSFEAMNPERQAELAMHISMSLDAGGELSRTRLEAVIARETGRTTYVLSDEMFRMAQGALRTLRAG